MRAAQATAGFRAQVSVPCRVRVQRKTGHLAAHFSDTHVEFTTTATSNTSECTVLGSAARHVSQGAVVFENYSLACLGSCGVTKKPKPRTALSELSAMARLRHLQPHHVSADGWPEVAEKYSIINHTLDFEMSSYRERA